MSLIFGISERIANWYRGKYVPPPENDPTSPVFILSVGHYERHWTAKAAFVLVGFYLAHWKWLWTTAIALLGLSFCSPGFK